MIKFANCDTSTDEIRTNNLNDNFKLKIKDALLRSIIEHDVINRFILENEYLTVLNQNKINLLEEKISLYINKYHSYLDYLKSQNLEKNLNHYLITNNNYPNINMAIQKINCLNIQNALIYSIEEKNVNYKFYLEYLYTRLLKNKEIPLEIISDIITNINLIEYILKANSKSKVLTK